MLVCFCIKLVQLSGVKPQASSACHVAGAQRVSTRTVGGHISRKPPGARFWMIWGRFRVSFQVSVSVLACIYEVLDLISEYLFLTAMWRARNAFLEELLEDMFLESLQRIKDLGIPRVKKRPYTT